MKIIGKLVLSSMLLTAVTAQAQESLSLSNGCKLTMTKDGDLYNVMFSGFDEKYRPEDDAPAVLYLYTSRLDSAVVYTAKYNDVTASESSLVCKATITSDAGTVFIFTDTYTAVEERQSFRMSRKVTVSKVKSADYAFNTLFIVRPVATTPQKGGYDYFLPSLVYKDNSNMPAYAIGADFDDKWILSREERLPLPLTMMRNRSTNVSVSLADYNLSPTTHADDWGCFHIVNNTMQ